MSYIFNPLQNESFIPVIEQVNNNNLENYSYPPSVNPPVNPKKNYKWIEVTAQGDWIEEWFWNGQYWLSQNFYNTHIPFGGGNAYFNTSQGQPFYIGNFNLYLIKYIASFYSSGNLTDIDYWTLNFGVNFANLYKLNVKAGNGGETLNFVTKTSELINLIYVPPNDGYFNFQFGKVGNAPAIGSPTAIVQHRFARR